ncbi:MAG: SCP2 sterol-binding domain-containing protein [Nitrospirae bacterium]|nr:SCP2 sterol-binding domain-containing protein [Nitrospirota bacterium]
MCIDLGADDAGFVEIGREEIAGQREDILKFFPAAKTLIGFVCRMNRENLRSPARSMANLELANTGNRTDSVACSIVRRLERMGVRAVSPAMGFPMEADRWPGKMQVLSHKPIAVAAGLGKMGLHRNVIHPVFGSFVLLGTVVMDAEVDIYNRPLEYTPCLNCKLCSMACPTGAISPDGFYNPVNCLTHTYRDLIGGFTDWVENVVDSKNSYDYRRRVSDAETISMWQSLAVSSCYKSVYCMAVCPAGEDVIEPFIENRKKYIDDVVRPLQGREETVYVLRGSDAEDYVAKTFPHKKIKRVGNGIRPYSIEVFLGFLPVAFQRNKSDGLNATYHFTFYGDKVEEATIVIGNKAITVTHGHTGTRDVHVRADEKAWLRMLRKESPMVKEIIFRRIRVRGPIKLLRAFGNCFA